MVVRYEVAVVVGLLLAAIVVFPVLGNNYAGTVGRESQLIMPGYKDLFHCLSCFISRWDQAPYWVRPSDHSTQIVMWLFYYAYLGIVPFACFAVGVVAALLMWKSNRAAFVCASICLVIFVCCCGDVWTWIAHVPLLGKLPKINIVPTRMTPLVLVFGICAASMSLSRVLSSLPRQKLVSLFVLAVMLWAAADYTLLFWQMERMQPIQEAKPLRSADVTNFDGFSQKLSFSVVPPYHVRFSEPHGWVPGNGMYFIMMTTGEVQLTFCEINSNFVANCLQIRSLTTGNDVKHVSATFTIPVADDIYRIYLKDGALTLGIFVSLATAVVCIVRRYRRSLAMVLSVLKR